MIFRQKKFGFLIIFLVFLICTVNAAASISTISQGNTVFIGEQGLDITGALGGATQIGWWASGAPVATSSPDQTYSVSKPDKFLCCAFNLRSIFRKLVSP